MEKVRIALVDDHHLVRQGIKLVIQSIENFDVVSEASNGEMLINNLKALPELPHIAVIDVSMPIMNGFETINYLSKHYISLKCIGMSVDADHNTVYKIIGAGAKGFIGKNSSPEQVKQILLQVYKTGSAFDGFVMERMMEHNIKTPIEEKKLSKLTKREMEFLVASMDDLTYRKIAEKMNVSQNWVVGQFEFI